jgi:hypothetical protein
MGAEGCPMDTDEANTNPAIKYATLAFLIWGCHVDREFINRQKLRNQCLKGAIN